MHILLAPYSVPLRNFLPMIIKFISYHTNSAFDSIQKQHQQKKECSSTQNMGRGLFGAKARFLAPLPGRYNFKCLSLIQIQYVKDLIQHRLKIPQSRRLLVFHSQVLSVMYVGDGILSISFLIQNYIPRPALGI